MTDRQTDKQDNRQTNSNVHITLPSRSNYNYATINTKLYIKYNFSKASFIII